MSKIINTKKLINKISVMVNKNQPIIFPLFSKFKPINANLVGNTSANPIKNEVPENIRTFVFNFKVSSCKMFAILVSPHLASFLQL